MFFNAYHHFNISFNISNMFVISIIHLKNLYSVSSLYKHQFFFSYVGLTKIVIKLTLLRDTSTMSYQYVFKIELKKLFPFLLTGKFFLFLVTLML